VGAFGGQSPKGAMTLDSVGSGSQSRPTTGAATLGGGESSTSGQWGVGPAWMHPFSAVLSLGS
jgi:hypothetical protein